MKTIETLIQIFTILFAFIGVFLALRTIALKRKINYSTLKARAFLNESFLIDVWSLLLLACLFFMIHAIIELIDIFSLTTIGPIIKAILTEGTELGVLVCTLLLVYKWFKLVNLAKYQE